MWVSFFFLCSNCRETRATCIITKCTNQKQDITMKPFMHMVCDDTSLLAKRQTRVSDCFGGLKVLVLVFYLQYCPHPVLTVDVYEFKSVSAYWQICWNSRRALWWQLSDICVIICLMRTILLYLNWNELFNGY